MINRATLPGLLACASLIVSSHLCAQTWQRPPALDRVTVYKNNIYIGITPARGHQRYIRSATRFLWDRYGNATTDRQQNAWKLIDIDELEQALGPLRRYYLSITPVTRPRTTDEPCIGMPSKGVCLDVLDHLEFPGGLQVESGALIKRECDGEIEIALNLGPADRRPGIIGDKTLVIGSDLPLEDPVLAPHDVNAYMTPTLMTMWPYAFPGLTFDGFFLAFLSGDLMAIDHTSGEYGEDDYYLMSFPSENADHPHMQSFDTLLTGC